MHKLVSLCLTGFYLFLGAVSLGLTSLVILVSFYYTFKVWINARKLNKLPWAGLKPESFSALRASLRDWNLGLQVVSDGYHKYGKSGQFFVTPTWWGQPLVTVPPAYFQWWSKELEPKTELPQTINNLESQRIALPGLPIGEHLYYQNVHNLKKLGPQHVLSWMKPNLEAHLHVSTDWTTLDIREEAVFQPTIRMIIQSYYGETLKNNSDFVEHIIDYARAFNGMDYRVAHFFPRWFSSIFWWIVANRPNGPLRNQRKYDRIIIPYLRQRLRDTADAKEQIEEHDLLSIYLKSASKSKDAVDRDPVVIAGRFLMLTSGFTVSTLTGVLPLVLKQLTSHPSYVNVLLEELEASIAEQPGRWDSKLLNSLVHMDSLFRESMRCVKFNGFGLALMRVITDPEGIKLPGNNPVVVPQGTWFGAPADLVHYDDSNYEDAAGFQPWRFAKADSEARASRNMMTALSDINLAFGRGKFACPGRFFASDFMKTYICYFITHYDIRPIPGSSDSEDPVRMQIKRKEVPPWWHERWV
ncbi:hypothetical protein M3J07_013804 [Ascochyta lentis]